jgi:uncharacterized small protein (DUF1192 family)
MTRSRAGAARRMAGAGLLLALSCGAAGARADEAAPAATPPAASTPASVDPADVDALRLRIKVLEDLVTRLLDEIERTRAGGTAQKDASIAELQKQVQALTEEIQRLKEAGTPSGADAGGGFEPGWSKVYRARRGLVIGGYGSGLFEMISSTHDDDTPSNAVNRADLTEAFLYFGYRFDDRFLFNSSLGIEHALVEDGSEGEATVEFAYLDWKATQKLGVRGGLLLLPLGWLNEDHEPTSYPGARRPDVELRIIPSTWREMGIGAYGEAGPVTWRAYVVTSLDASGFTP